MAQVLLAGEGLVEVEYAEAGDGQGRMLGEGQFFVSLGLADAQEPAGRFGILFGKSRVVRGRFLGEFSVRWRMEAGR